LGELLDFEEEIRGLRQEEGKIVQKEGGEEFQA